MYEGLTFKIMKIINYFIFKDHRGMKIIEEMFLKECFTESKIRNVLIMQYKFFLLRFSNKCISTFQEI